MAGHNHSSNHGTTRSYIIGFLLSILLTAIPFTMVAREVLPKATLAVALIVIALVQLFVQVVFFLHLTTKQEGRWNLMAFLFTVLVVFILVVGSLWIMYNLNYNMVN